MNKFYWYSFVAFILVLFDLLQKYFSIASKNVYDLFYSILLLFHFIFLSLFIYRVLPNKKNSKYLKLLFFLFLLVILFCLFTNDLSIPQSTAYAFTNLGLVLFCCFYYLQLFDEMPTVNLLKEPAFWIISGIFFCMCATIPLNSLRGYLLDNIPYEIYLSMGGIGFFAYGVMHLFFIKAYLCSTSQPKA
ncbi:MAG: hypothetical protein ABI760_03995 [Ferruginibacter sp.]